MELHHSRKYVHWFQSNISEFIIGVSDTHQYKAVKTLYSVKKLSSRTV
jgi:hypothetical protein